MAYTYARRKSSRRHWPKLLAGAVVFFPLSLTRVDFRAGFGRGLAISTHRASPAYAALEDLRADFGPVVDLAQSELPNLETARVTVAASEVRQIALTGTTIRQPAAPVMVAEAPPVTPTDLYADPENGVTLAAVAQRLVRQELAKARPEQILASTLGTQIIVRGNSSAKAPRAATAPADVAFKPKFVSLASLAANPGLKRAFWLDGQIEMTGGLAYTGDDVEMVVKRTLDGQTLERGRIWITEGRFEIHVSAPTGQLIAELRTRRGQVFGRGEINLIGVAGASPRDLNRIGDLRIALRPTSEYAAVRAISAYSHREHKLALNQASVRVQSASQALTVDDEGVAVEPDLGRGSSFLARAEAPGHRPSLAIARAEKLRDVRLLSNAMVNALVELERKPLDRAKASVDGIVWGQVSVDGAAAAGATVELTAGLEPIYFNDLYLPDRHLSRTSGNGLFAFLNVPPGVQAARVRHQRRAYPAQIFAAEDQHVSVLDFELNDTAIAQFKVTDVLNERGVRPAELHLVGTDAKVQISGDDAVTFASAGGPTMVEADAGPEFEISRGTLAAEAGDVNLPVVRRAWLEGLHERAHVAADDARGAVVGFIDGHDFTVEMTGAVLNEKLNVVYFDRAGTPLEAHAGVAGGGFAILNAPPGVQTVTVRPVQARATFAQLVVAEPNLVNVLSWAP